MMSLAKLSAILAVLSLVSPLASGRYLFVNEVNLHITGSVGVDQFVELACRYSRCSVPSHYYKLAFIDSETLYKVIDIPGRSHVSDDEKILVGPAAVNPDVDWGDFEIHLDSPSAVVLFIDQRNQISAGINVPSRGVYSYITFTMHNPVGSIPSSLSTFYPGAAHKTYLIPEADKSINTCDYWKRVLASPTPKTQNACPSVVANLPQVIINELNAASPQRDRHEFVELRSIASVPVNLGEYTLVLYDGARNTAYKVIPLRNATLPAGDFYVIGSPRLWPPADQILEEGTLRVIQNGADAVALYKGSQSNYQVNMGVTDEGLVDAIVYDVRGRHSEILTATLTPGEETLHEDWRALNTDESLSRCNGSDPRKSSQFMLKRRSNGRANLCSRTYRRRPTRPGGATDADLSPVIINEFSLEVSNQYVELYDGGIGNYSLDGILVVLYRSRTMRVFRDPLSLSGYSTDANGYFLIKVGSTNSDTEISLTMLLTVDINAICLYLESINNIRRNSYVTTKNLVDVVLYGTPSVSQSFDLADALLPGVTPLSMDEIMIASNSYSRCRGWSAMQLSSFVIAQQSPSARNQCPLPAVVINEIDLAREPERRFIELFGDGESGLSLDGLVLVIYQRSGTAPGYIFKLDDYRTNELGFATVGHENGTNVDVVINNLYLGWTYDIGAVALYLGSVTALEYSETVPTDGLVDALVVSGAGEDPNLDLMNALTPLQKQLNDLSEDTSISRCFCCLTLKADNFGIGPPSPGAINPECRISGEVITESLQLHQALLRINEVSTTPGGDGMFIELYDGGYSGVTMEDLTLSLYSTEFKFYSHYALEKEGPLGKTNSGGFYNVGTQNSGTDLNVILHGNERLLPETTNSIVLWKKDNIEGAIPSDLEINRDDIIDVVVFSDSSANNSYDRSQNDLFRAFAWWDNITVNATFMSGGYSISRCHSRSARALLAFTSTTFTPGAINECPLPPVVINEFNFMVQGEELVKFIELSSLGVRFFPLDDIVLTLYAKSGTVSKSYSINGRSTDWRGFFILGHKITKFPPLDMTIFTLDETFVDIEAVALYRGEKRDFPEGRTVTNTSLIDAVVFGRDPVNRTLIETLTPGRSQLPDETNVERSIGRCQDDEGKNYFRSSNISPKYPNFCPFHGRKLVINEVSLQPQKQFIEVWDLGIGLTALDNVSIVLFDNDGHAYMDIPLSDYRSETGGYFVIGTGSVTPRSHYGSGFAEGFIRMSGAVALYKRAEGYPTNQETISTEGLLDAVVYSDESEPLSADLQGALSPDSSPLPSLLLQEEDLSLSRCFSERQLNMEAFSTRPVTPLGLNDCPVFETDVFINELNMKKGEDDFVEISDGGRGNTSLDGLTIVLFDGQYQDRAYAKLSLNGVRTFSHGFRTIRALSGFLYDGPVGVALYRAPATAFTFGTPAEPRSIVDAIVYSLNNETADSLVTTLTPGYPIFRPQSGYDTLSISRCYGNKRRNPTSFGLAPPTVLAPNNCSSATVMYPLVVINEVNIEPVDSNSQYEFIELYDLGTGGTSLDGYSLVFYDGGNEGRSYFEVDLNGERTDTNGYFTLGRENPLFTPSKVISNNFIHNGPDAIVLYRRPAADFPRATVATTEGAIDALVYGSDDDVTSTLVDKLVPGQIQINEQQLYLGGKASLSRCLSNETMALASFISSSRTPGAPNSCTMLPLYINEINLDTSKDDRADFIELYDGGRGYTPLDAVVLILYSEAAGIAFRSLPLQNNMTDRNGYFTIGGADITTDVTIDSAAFWGLLAKYPGAVALYRGSNQDYQAGIIPTVTNLMDAVILGGEANPATLLGSALAPDQPQLLEQKFFLEGDESVSRCTCCNAVQMTDFALGPATPQAANTCTMLGTILDTRGDDRGDQFVVINEVSMVVDGDDGALPMEVELYGSPGMSLDSYVLVYYSVGTYLANSYLMVSLSGCKTDKAGFYTLTQDKAASLEHLGASRGSKDSVRAVALYDRYRGEYSYGMRVTDKGLVDAVTFTEGHDKAGSLSNVLSLPLTGIVRATEAAKVYLKSYKPLSISRCACCSTRNNSAFALTTWSPDKANTCPDGEYQTTIHLRLLNAEYARWSANSAWSFHLKSILARGVEDACQCGFTLANFKNERLIEGSVVFAAELAGLDKDHVNRMVQSYKTFVAQNSTITIMDQIFTLDRCTENCVWDPNAQYSKGKAGGIILALLGIIVVVALIVAAVILARKYRADIHMIYVKTFKSRGDPDGVRFNNNQNFDDGVVNPAYEGSIQIDSSMPGPQYPDPTENPTGEVPVVVTS